MLQYDSSHFSPQILSYHFCLHNYFHLKTSIVLLEMLPTSSIFRCKIIWAVHPRKVFLQLCHFQEPLMSSDMSQ